MKHLPCKSSAATHENEATHETTPSQNDILSGKKTNEAEDEKKESCSTETVWRCKICRYYFVSNDALLHHIMKIHPAQDGLACTACGMKFSDKQRHVKHLERCSAPHPCKHCWRLQASDGELEDHEICLYFCLYDHICMACHKHFIDVQDCKSHVLYEHPEAATPCEHCGLLCTNDVTLMKHKSICPEPKDVHPIAAMVDEIELHAMNEKVECVVREKKQGLSRK